MSRAFIVDNEAWNQADKFIQQYESTQTGLGHRFRDQLFKTFDRIERFPLAYAKIRRRYRLADVKKFPFAVGYFVSRFEVIVIAIIPTRSNPQNWFRGS